MTGFDFPPPALPPGVDALRAEVRAFVAKSRAAEGWRPDSDFGSDWSASFSRALGARGWIGMCWPARYGGHERSALERYVVIEELLAAGAPVYAHWVADRQSGPLLLRFGSEAQRRSILPRIAAGDCYFAIGMSEPDSGSDLASVRTRALRTNEGWRIDGTKLWTSNAHRSHYMIALCRTGPAGEDRHGGLSQFLIDLEADGVQVNPIVNLAGKHDFNECVFEDVAIPADRLIGAAGEGWRQVTGELALERSGPERILSTVHLLAALVEAAGPAPEARLAEAIGRLSANLYALRAMSLAVAGQLEAGESPEVEAAIVKDMGTRFEVEVAETLRRAVPVEPVAGGNAGDNAKAAGGNGSANAHTLASALGASLLALPSFTLRGGTNEILRSIIARGLGMR